MAKLQSMKQWIVKTALASVVAGLCAASAYAIWPGTESIKLSPLTIALESSGLKGEALLSETQAAKQLFDNATTTAYTSQNTREIIATLEDKNTLHAIKVYGAAPYRLNVDSDQSGAWSALPGLQNVDLSNLGSSWNSLPLGTATQTGRLRFTLTPITAVIDTSERHEEGDDHEKSKGLRELEIWGEGTRVNVKNVTSLLDALQNKSEPPAQGRQYIATPEQGIIGAPDKMSDDLTDNTFTVKLPRNPSDYKRIYLAYEVNGIAHWVHALRQINGNAAQGGFGMPISEAWSAQVESINPAWLKQGANTITFAPPKGETGSFTVKNIRLVGELDNGSNFVTRAVSNTSEAEAQSVLDGDTGSGWKPYASSSNDGMPKLTLNFDKPTQVSDLKFFLSNQLKGKFHIEYLKDEEHWIPAARGAIEGKSLVAGWNMLEAASGSTVNGMRLVFANGAGSSADIREIVVSGSGKGDTWPATINFSYPDAGQYFGRIAYLRGYLQPVDNGSGIAKLTIGGKHIAQTDGAFGVAISKDDIGLKKQSDRTAWSVEVKATYPNGKTVSRTIKLNKHADAIDPKSTKLPSTYKKTAKPGQHEKLEFDGAGLELNGSEIDKDITLGISTLTAKDLAVVNPGMTNVTKAGQGYRFTPTPMKFKSKLQITIPYDPALLPKGKTEKDIKTFYYDTANNKWRELERFTIDKTQKKIVSMSDHFTDMINATVTVPEHPDAVSFNPNSIKDIKAADPGANINLIEPPKANNTGDARLSYPIEIPPGRQGLQPNLSVNYSSGGGNGWMGLGWDIPQQSISIDTRWGVPRYDAAKETETYLLDGEQLTPLAHRGEQPARTANKIFHTRIEGAFRKIQRHGDTPANYWWEVTDKNGMRYIYGGNPSSGLDSKAVLTAPGGGNIFKWMLKEIRDTHGNNVRYHYDVVKDTTAAQPWSQIYLSRISYTGTGDADGPYEIKFTREGGRTDVTIDGRSGFKTVMNQRLTGIDVKFNNAGNPLIRSYAFNYEYGAFNKTLLKSVSQYGDNGTLFNTHTFAYYDEARQGGNYRGFTSAQGWSGLGSDLAGETLIGGRGAPSALGGTKGEGSGGAFYIGIGAPGTDSKEDTGGIKVGYNDSSSETLSAMSDMNGDGLPDKVFKSSVGYSYQPNRSGPNGKTEFGSPVQLANLNGIGRDRSTSTTFSFEEYWANSMHAFNDSDTESDTYMSDVNGDGLTDAVISGQVWFGHLDSNGAPTYSTNSADTPVQVGAGQVASIIQDNTAIEAARAKNFPLLDTVRRWVAPFDGVIKIEAPVQLVQDSGTARTQYKTADGVRVAIQLEDTELWHDTIGAEDYAPHTPADIGSVTVRKGQRLYFRVQSVYDGAYDTVNWSPVITYTNGSATLKDENLMSPYRYEATKEYVLSGRRSQIMAPVKGTVHVVGTLKKRSATSDDVTLLITKNGNDVMRRVLAHNGTDSVDLTQDIQVEERDKLDWRLLSDSPIDLTQIGFDPGNELAAYYTEAFSPPRTPSGLGDPVKVVDAKGNYTQKLTLVGNLLAGARVMSSSIYIGTLHIGGKLKVAGTLSGDAILTVTQNGNEIKRHIIPQSGNTTLDLALDVEVKANDAIFLKLTPNSAGDLAKFSFVAAAPLTEYYTQAWKTPSTAGLVGDPIPVKDAQDKYILQLNPVLAGELYPDNDLAAARTGYSVGNNGALLFEFSLTAENLELNKGLPVVLTVKRPGELLAKKQVEIFAVEPGQPVTRNFSLSVNANKGDKLYFDFTTRDPHGMQKITAHSVSVVTSGLNSTPVASVLNSAIVEGDLYPASFRNWSVFGYNGNDVRATTPINQANLQLPNMDSVPPSYKMSDMPVFPYKALGDKNVWGGADDKAWASATAMSASRLGLDYIGVAQPGQYAGATAVSRISRSSTDSDGIFGVVAGSGSTNSVLDFQDLNGDRFPDVLSSNTVQFTNMNGGLGDTVGTLGGSPRRSTNDSQSFDSSGLASAQSVHAKANGRVNPGGGGSAAGSENGHTEPSFSAGGGIGRSDVESELMDMNGDGLPDMVYRSGAVALNLGYSFGAPEAWGGGDINAGVTDNENINMGFSYDSGSVAGGLTLGMGHSKTNSTYVDINGDGLPDKVTGSSPLAVSFNTGSGFLPNILWNGGQGGIARDENYNLGGGVYFSYNFDVWYISVCLNPGINYSTTRGRPELAFRDMDGDGFVDHLQSNADSQLSVAANPIGRTNLLRSVARPLGAGFELEYSRDGNTYDMPQSRWVLSKTRVHDGVQGDGVDTLLTAYQYEGGKYDRNERDFYGYATVTEQQLIADIPANVVYRSIVRDYLNGNYYTKGLLKRERMRKGDNDNEKYTETENTYVLFDTVNNLALNQLSDADKITSGTLFPQLKRTDRRFYEGTAAAGKASYTEYAYDPRGNVTQFKDYGDSGTADDVVADIGYSQCENTYIVGKPLSITVIGNGVLMRQREAGIECARGNIIQVRQLLETAQAAITDLDYYGNGNLKSVTGPANAKNQRHQVEYDYDQQVQTHITGIRDASYNLSSVAAYNFKYGKVEATTDTNGNITRMEYDQYGRTTAVYGPYDQGTGTPTIRFEYHPEAPVPFAASFHLDRDANGNLKPGGTIDTILFTDGLKRVIQTKKDATIHVSPISGTQDVMTVSGRVLFDELGRTTEQYYPVTEAKGGNFSFNPGFDTIAPTRTVYDAIDRTVRTVLPDGTTTSMIYGFGADRNGQTQFMTTVIDANQHRKESYRDVNELITTVREYNGGQTIQTSYVYDPLKQITQVIDDRGNQTRVKYDNLGRRTVIDNADTGRTETVYDTAGNVIQKITANLKGQGKSVLYDYDYNRLTAISYPTFPANNVSYTYGASGDAYNRAGRIATVVHAAGVEARYYGKLGETVKENFCRKSEHCKKGSDADRPNSAPGNTVDGHDHEDGHGHSKASAQSDDGHHDIEDDNDDAPLYVTLYKYDTFGRLQRLTYPDAEVLTYGYDSGGLVNSATGVKGKHSYAYLTRLDYDKFDQRVFLKLGNGVETSYTYRQDNRRLEALQAQLPNITRYRFQNLAYRYDNVGNILGIANNSLYPEHQPGIGEEVGGPVSQTFAYDDLYRLKEANGEYRHEADELQRYRLSMAYDTIHNITSKEQLHEEVETEHGKTEVEVEHETSYTYSYQYAAAQAGSNVGSIHPHAPSDIGPYAFQYDSNGNQIERRYRDDDDTRQIIWDEDNRMACVHEFEHHHPHKLLPQTPNSCSSTSSKESSDGKSKKDGSHTPEVRFTYNDRGERVYKESHENVSFYLNPHYTEKSDDAFKHILIGTTRLATKEVEDEKYEYEDDQYYYHPDHLGSSSFVTDHKGKLEEHLEYFPFGETWVEEESSLPIAFQFTAKELDHETGLYYYGARYYDPRTSIWQSADPILDKYLPNVDSQISKLVGMGGIYNSPNLGMYGYSHLNPLKFSDPDGNSPISVLAKQIAKVGLQHGMKNFVEKNIQRRLNHYMSDKMKKEFAEDVVDVMDSLDSSPLEIAIEMIPGVGDLYGAAKFGKKTALAFKKLQDIENKYVEQIAKSLPKDQRAKFMKSMRNAGVNDARKDNVGGGYASGKDLEGHHVDYVKDNPGKASDPSNIEFMTKKDHIQLHKENP